MDEATVLGTKEDERNFSNKTGEWKSLLIRRTKKPTGRLTFFKKNMRSSSLCIETLISYLYSLIVVRVWVESQKSSSKT